MSDAFALFASLDSHEAMLLAIAALLASLVAGLSGMGGGMLLAVAVSPVVGVEALVPILTVTMLINHVARVSAFYQHAEWPTAGRVLLTAIPTTIIGAFVYSLMAADTVAIVIGVFVLLFVPARRLFGESAWKVSNLGFMGVGAVFGFVSGAALGGGMIIIPVLLGSGLSGATLIGTDAIIGLAVLVAKAGLFGALSVLTTSWLIFGAVVGIVTIPGVYLARWLVQKSSVRVHTLLVECVLLVGGGSFVWRGFTGQ
jgi:uncharacterized protein